MTTALIAVPAPGTIDPQEVRSLDSYHNGRELDGLTLEALQAHYSQAVMLTERRKRELAEAEAFRPDYAPGPTRTEETLKVSVRVNEAYTRYLQIRYWLLKKGADINRIRR